jgi:hypothetical protein
MKPLLAPLACGTLVAALLYGLLSAAERQVPEPEDPWLDAWIGDGMKADFRAASLEPDKHALPGDARELFGAPGFAGTQLRTYIVQNTSVQVVRFPKAALAPSLPEGRTMDFRFRPQGNSVHISRSGRLLLFVSPMQRSMLGIGQMKTSKAQVEQIFKAFEETVKKYP